MRIGIIGLDKSGKTSLFHALTGISHQSNNAPKRKGDAHLSIVKVPDVRLDRLHELYPTAKKTPATIEYLDIAGLAKGSSQRGFQDRLLADLRTVDALLCILRNFDNGAVPHAEGSIDPRRDWEIINTEFLFSDISIVDKRIQRLEKDVKKIKDEGKKKELELLQKCNAALESEQPLRELDFNEADEKKLRGFQFLTAKPALLVSNINEADSETEVLQQFQDLSGGRNRGLVALSAKLEEEISQLSEEDTEIFRKEMGIAEPALDKMIRNSYQLLELISFFTAGEKDVRAWTIKKGTKAQNAAGEIHSDMERGFIRAEVVDFDTLSELGSLAKCRQQGVLRLDGKEYIVKDGNVITFRFNV